MALKLQKNEKSRFLGGSSRLGMTSPKGSKIVKPNGLKGTTEVAHLQIEGRFGVFPQAVYRCLRIVTKREARRGKKGTEVICPSNCGAQRPGITAAQEKQRPSAVSR
jgi:hypothetical protein